MEEKGRSVLTSLGLRSRVLTDDDQAQVIEVVSKSFIQAEPLMVLLKVPLQPFAESFVQPLVTSTLSTGFCIGIEDENNRLVAAVLNEELPLPGQHPSETQVTNSPA